MNTSCISRSRGSALWFLLAICSLPICFGSAARAELPAAPPPMQSSPVHGVAGISAPFASQWWEKAYAQFASFLGSKDRMLQFGAVGMALGLFIIWYRKP